MALATIASGHGAGGSPRGRTPPLTSLHASTSCSTVPAGKGMWYDPVFKVRCTACCPFARRAEGVGPIARALGTSCKPTRQLKFQHVTCAQVRKFDGEEVWRRRHYRVRRDTAPGAFKFSVLDNGVVSNENWWGVAPITCSAAQTLPATMRQTAAGCLHRLQPRVSRCQ